MPDPSSIWDDTFRFEPDQIATDPLLGSDSFIAATADFAAADQNDAVKDGGGDEEPSIQSDPAPQTPTTTKKTKPKANKTTSSRKLPRKGADFNERPDWLPENWQMTAKTRTNGQTAGSTDRYYIDPVSGHRFRSKNEVVSFLETGIKVKPKRKLDTDGNAAKLQTPGGKKEKKKKDGPKSDNSAQWSFDFQNPPEEVTWSLVDVSEGVWKPSLGDQHIPELSKQEWTSTYERICNITSNTT